MSKTSEKLFKAALELPREERLYLAHQLLSTVVDFGCAPGPFVTKEEILEAADEALTGKAKTVDAVEVLNRLERKLTRAKAKAA